MPIARVRAGLRRRIPLSWRLAAWKVLEFARRTPPALLMRYGGASPPAVPALPEPYVLHPWQPGDDEGWRLLLERSGEFGHWTGSRMQSEMRGLVREAQFFVFDGAAPVAAAGILARRLDGRPALELAWVVADTRHRGRGVGRAVVAAAVCAALADGPGRPQHVYLHTDDHRLPAIALYLSLGFVPDLTSHRGYPRRWQAVFSALAAQGGR